MLQAAMHTVTGATSIAGLKKWAAQQPPPGADGAASAQYVAVASDACNIEFDFLGRPHAHTCRAGVAVPAAVALVPAACAHVGELGLLPHYSLQPCGSRPHQLRFQTYQKRA